jgi:translation initiation factor IF-2
LLDHLRKEHGTLAPKNKITLTRKSNTEIKKTDSMGKARTIQVEVRKKRVVMSSEEAEAEVSAPVIIEEIVEETISAELVAVEVIVPALETVVAVAEETPAAPEVVEVEKKSTTLKKQVLTPEQVAIREQEAKRHATLAQMQAEDVRKKQELVQRRLDEEARKLAEAEAAKVKAAKLKEGTLHKPAAKVGAAAKPATKDAKKGKGTKKKAKNAGLKRVVTRRLAKVGVRQKASTDRIKMMTLNTHLMRQLKLLCMRC